MLTATNPRIETKADTQTNNGTQAQDCVQQSLQYLEQYKRGSFIRLYDSTSSGAAIGGNFIPSNPGDFILLLKSRGILIEVKSSIVHKHLQDCTLRNTFRECQILGSRLWTRADGISLGIFMALPSKVIEVWDMPLVVNAWKAPPRQRKLVGEPLYVGVWSIPTLALALLSIAEKY